MCTLVQEGKDAWCNNETPPPPLPDFGKITAFAYAGNSIGQSWLLTEVSVATWSGKTLKDFLPVFFGFSLSFRLVMMPALDLGYLQRSWS